MAETSPSRRRRFRLIALGLALLLALLGAEALVRVRHYMKHGTFGEIYQFEIDEKSGLRVPPVGVNGPITINGLHFRGPEIEQPKPEGRVRVAFLGGSTTFCAEASGDEKVWPAVCIEQLRQAFPEGSLDFVNGAAAGYDSGSSKRNLEHRVGQLSPDIVVVYHGTNDFALDSQAQAREQGIEARIDEDWLEGVSMAWSLVKKNLLMDSRTGDDVRKIDMDLERATETFAERYRAVLREAKTRSRVVAAVTFAHKMRPGQDAATLKTNAGSALLYAPFLTPEAIRDGIEAYNEVIRRVAKEEGVLLIDDVARIPANSEHYADSVHFTDAGCQAMGTFVAEQLAAAAEVKALLQ